MAKYKKTLWLRSVRFLKGYGEADVRCAIRGLFRHKAVAQGSLYLGLKVLDASLDICAPGHVGGDCSPL